MSDDERGTVACCRWEGGAILSRGMSPVEREPWSVRLCLSVRERGLDRLASCATAERCGDIGEFVGRWLLLAECIEEFDCCWRGMREEEPDCGDCAMYGLDGLRGGREGESSGERKDVLDGWREAVGTGNGRVWVREGEDFGPTGERVEDASVGDTTKLFRQDMSMTDKGTDAFARGTDALVYGAWLTGSNGRGRASCPAINPRFLRRNITTAKHRTARIIVPPTDAHTAMMIVS